MQGKLENKAKQDFLSCALKLIKLFNIFTQAYCSMYSISFVSSINLNTFWFHLSEFQKQAPDVSYNYLCYLCYLCYKSSLQQTLQGVFHYSYRVKILVPAVARKWAHWLPYFLSGYRQTPDDRAGLLESWMVTPLFNVVSS